jgi:hypothetical protein
MAQINDEIQLSILKSFFRRIRPNNASFLILQLSVECLKSVYVHPMKMILYKIHFLDAV